MIEFSPGLAGVPAAKSKISFVDGQTGLLEYRGIRIEELAARIAFLETTYLLLYDRLPTQAELDRFTSDIAHHHQQLFVHADRAGARPRHREGAGHLPHSSRRAHDERLDVQRDGHCLDARRSLQRRLVGHRNPEGSLARGSDPGSA